MINQSILSCLLCSSQTQQKKKVVEYHLTIESLSMPACYTDALHFKTRKRTTRIKTIPPEEPPTL